MDKPFSTKSILVSIVFISSFLSPALIPLVAMSDLPAIWKTVFVGGLTFGIPKVMALVAVAIMGKEGFQDVKRLLWRLFKKVAPPEWVAARGIESAC